jgi:repressor LexA
VTMTKQPLTQRRQAILDFIVEHIEENGYPPTVREIGQCVGLSSSSSVHFHLKALEKGGYIQRDGSLTRAIRPNVSERETGDVRDHVHEIPLVGRVAAGQPVLATENIEEMLPMPENLFPDEDLFMLEVTGDSMVNAGILDGDYVIVRCQDTAENGDIIVALLDDEATVKRLYVHADHIELRPENDNMASLRSSDVEVIGLVRGVVRRLR